jgi:uncharacterized RDD family membrane protein YckC
VSAPIRNREVASDREALDTTTDVETPEHVRFRYRTAGPARRAVAYLVDLLLRGAAAFVLVLLGATAGLLTGGASMGFVLLGIFALEWGYYVLFETLWGGRTLGKRVAGLRVVKEGGYPITFLDAVLRNLLRAADFLPAGYALGLVVMGRDARFRRLGDLVAGTIVVIEEQTRVGARLEISPPPTPAELEAIPARPSLSAQDLEAIELFLRRRGTLTLAREEELAQMVAPIFARRMGLEFRDGSRFLALLYHRATHREQRV